MSLDPTPPSSLNVALTLAQAALQRQNQLLEALGGKGVPQETASVSTPPSPVAGNGSAPAAASTPPQSTAGTDTRGDAPHSSPLRLSASALAQLASNTATDLLSAQATRPNQAAIPPPPLSWPEAELDEPTRALIDTVLKLAPLLGPTGTKLLAVQAWPPTLVQRLVSWAIEQKAGLPPPNEWQPWPIPASMVQTAAGRQPLQATLWLPSTGTGAAPQAAADEAPLHTATPLATQLPASPPASIATTAPRLLLPQQTTPLASAWYALLLETESGEHGHALLALELGAPQATTLYGRDLFTPRSDPWQQQAVLLASGLAPRVTRRPGENARPTCQTAHCPYQGRAACPQPFCPDALRIQPVR